MEVEENLKRLEEHLDEEGRKLGEVVEEKRASQLQGIAETTVRKAMADSSPAEDWPKDRERKAPTWPLE